MSARDCTAAKDWPHLQPRTVALPKDEKTNRLFHTLALIDDEGTDVDSGVARRRTFLPRHLSERSTP